MKPIDYIYENIDCFNLTIFKQILEESGETVSEEIYDYLMETTWNTNPALLKQYGLDIERSNEEDKEKTHLVIHIIDMGSTDDIINQDTSTIKTLSELIDLVVNQNKAEEIEVFLRDTKANYQGATTNIDGLVWTWTSDPWYLQVDERIASVGYDE